MEEMRKKMEERVHLIRQQMEEAAGQAGRAPEEITLLAASKTQSQEIVALSAALPIDLFGENRVQELVEKRVFLMMRSRWQKVIIFVFMMRMPCLKRMHFTF